LAIAIEARGAELSASRAVAINGNVCALVVGATRAENAAAVVVVVAIVARFARKVDTVPLASSAHTREAARVRFIETRNSDSAGLTHARLASASVAAAEGAGGADDERVRSRGLSARLALFHARRRGVAAHIEALCVRGRAPKRQRNERE
jgi:hypothetical protein